MRRSARTFGPAHDIPIAYAPVFCTYRNDRNFDPNLDPEEADPLGPEGIHFVPWYESPNRQPLLIVTNEVSGSILIYQVERSHDPCSAFAAAP
jgi:hypothetical protein